MEQFARYKIIVEVTVGQKLGQCMRIASRGLWDASTDKCALVMFLDSLFRRAQMSFSSASTALRYSWASTYVENDTLFCVAIAFGVYYE